MSDNIIPAYLAKSYAVNGRFYGKLYKDKKGRDRWIIEGEPMMIQMAKRLFPGSKGTRGMAEFHASPRKIGDLIWMMQKYPLEIEDTKQWDEVYNRCVEHTLESMKIAAKPTRALPSTDFKGTLYPFQEEGLAWMLHHRRTLLADEMGLGKTVEFLAFLSATKAYPCLVVVQPHLVKQWERKIDEFLDGATAHVIRGLTPYPLPGTHIHIVHYGLLRGWSEELPAYETVCFDEIQELRRQQSLKYSASSIVAGEAQNVFGLSGTPIYNRGGEIWSILNIIEMHCLGDWDSFTREWCTYYGNDAVKDPTVLHSLLTEEGLMIRRTKIQVIPELPPKRRVVEEIDADEGTFGSLTASLIDTAIEYTNTKDVLKRGRMRREIVNSVRQATGIAKAPYVAVFVKALLDAGETCLVFAHHHKVVDILMEGLSEWRPPCITGRENQKEKDESVRLFQEGERNICIISIRSATGLDMPRAKCVIFAELDWSPAVHSQAEDRAHRIGQTDSVLAYYLVWPGPESSDPDVMDKLGFKTQQFKGLMGDPDETEEDRMLAEQSAQKHMERVIQKLVERGRR